ncbi:N-acetylmuramoyl-L-alanine amidase [Mucilaginibacter mali]|uniref:N-acetylmuramoyl-L-alanine amidase n=1 Tax=Mucilaginibacter mali TaxID=2740462 RepID=A0A7D4QMT3_9SPHI|nr:N-acetylmuramoyl-L-alanine amidase [Mucilaginibacter mali]QKJ32070.1 N-acetylmuramoyl-L-alanine amidase [Mucilaginibacter mali]
MKKTYPLYFCLATVALLSACSPKGPYAVTNKVYTHQKDSLLLLAKSEQAPLIVDSTGTQVPTDWVGTVNFGIRKPNYVIIHYTAQDSLGQTIKTFTVKHSAVSAHYVVAKSGKIVHMVNDYLRANQAGVGKWGSITDMNSCSIGIEIDNNGAEPYPDVQIKSLLALLAKLKKDYGIPQANFIGHQDWAPKRKPDPGPLFPWKVMAAHGFSFWSDEVLELAPDNYDYITALRLIGYDTSTPKDAIVAFKRHFVQSDITPTMTQLDLNILYNISKKYQ